MPADDRSLELRDGGGGTVTVDLSRGRAATEGGVTRRIDADEYLRRVETHAASAARRDPSVETLNQLRGRLAAVAEALGGGDDVVTRFDAAVASIEEAAVSSALVDVVPVAVHSPAGWVLSLERWTDHWRLVAIADGPALWTAVDDRGVRYGGDRLDADVVRFDPPLAERFGVLTLEWLGRDGTSVEVEVRR